MGLLTGDEAILYAADVRPDDELAGTAVDDRHRHQPRTVPTSGAARRTSPGSPRPAATTAGCCAPTTPTSACAVFPDQTAADQTTAHLESGLVVRATGYGEPFAYRPEQRPAMAVDGDPSTAWVVGDRADPVGERLEVSSIDGQLTLLQPQDTVADRMITAVRIAPLDGSSAPVDVALDESSLVAPGQLVELPGHRRAGDGSHLARRHHRRHPRLRRPDVGRLRRG